MISILGINIDNDIKNDELLLRVSNFLNSNKQNYIITPNPEIILQAQKDEEFFNILNKADLSLADGFGLKIAATLLGKKLNRITGADVVLEILSIAQKLNKKVLIINNKNGLSSKEEISIALKNRYQGLNFLIKDCDCNFSISDKRKIINLNFKKENFLTGIIKKAENKINEIYNLLVDDKLLNFSADILICNFGAPYQEKFIFHNLNKLPSVKLAIGIGGALDFLTGKIVRAPKLMRKMGLEWLWRLFKQPHRYKRIYRAVFVFLFKFFKWHFINPFFYRKNVACFLYKKEPVSYTALENRTRSELENYQVLLIKRSNELNHWQIPQGGLDVDSIRIAGIREIYEELGITNFTPKKVFKNVFKYKSDHSGRYGYKGQCQSLLLAEFIGKDTDIRINYWDHSDWKWVKVSDVLNEVHPIRRQGMEIFLNKFKEYLNIK
jgi:N-acetylglucosaminyldiphosphoundecaprenol N-acetyl-beta-D-mannosaminyltransferase